MKERPLDHRAGGVDKGGLFHTNQCLDLVPGWKIDGNLSAFILSLDVRWWLYPDPEPPPLLPDEPCDKTKSTDEPGFIECTN